MTIPDEVLMAYADGALSPQDEARIADALKIDAVAAQKVAAFRAQRTAVQAVFEPLLQEIPPQRLIDAAQARTGQSRWFTSSAARTGAAGMAMAASFVAGLMIAPQSAPTSFETKADGVFVRGALANALNGNASGESRDGVTIAMTTPAESGGFCRAFIAEAMALEAVACTEESDWRIVAMSERAKEANGAAYRTASGALSSAVLAALEARRAGDPLGADEERAWLQQRATKKP